MLPSRPSMKVATRVTSVWNAIAIRSNIKLRVVGEMRPGQRTGLFDGRRGLFGYLFGELDAALDFADRSQVLVDFATVGGAELAGKAARVVQNIIEDACFIAQALAAIDGILVQRAEQAFEDRARIHFGRQGRGRSAPGKRVAVGAAIAGIAVADHAAVFASRARAREVSWRAEWLAAT